MVCLTPQHHACPAKTYAILVASDGVVCFAVDMEGETEGSVDDAIAVCETLMNRAGTPAERRQEATVLGLIRAIKKAKEK